VNLAAAQEELRQLKIEHEFLFLGDELGAQRMPPWVKTGNQTTDGHLLELASAYSAKLATLDARIPGAEFIPIKPDFTWEVREPRFTYAVGAVPQ
jgi:hypothetical protein